TVINTTKIQSNNDVSTYVDAQNNTQYDINDILSMSFEDFKTNTGIMDKTKHDSALYSSTMTLWNMANKVTDDDTLNEVLFDKAKEVLAHEGTTGATTFHLLGPLMIMDVDHEQLEAFIAHISKYGTNEGFRYEQNSEPSIPKTHFYTKDEFLNKLDSFKGFYEKSLSEGSVWNTDMSKVFRYMDSIKEEYEKRLSENETALNQILKA
ncbi:MAG: hypothetical protein HRT43_09225, partial [Campylobacteraceae bacterium]|nr:hypothetical protein [Campylobacteraceae bacterium]